jgi:hypothetical protein
VDNQTGPTALNEYSAAEALGDFLEPPKQEETPQPDTELDTPAKAEPEAEPVEAQEADDGVEIEVDGKPVKLTKAELAEAVKGQMRQADYTKKTMEVAEQRKEAQAEKAQALAQREQYATALQQQAAVLQAALGEQQKTDWNALLDSDPVEYLKQRNLFEQRQAALGQSVQQLQVIDQQRQAEAQENRSRFLSQQQDELLAKLPEWKDEGKAKAEKEALSKYLKDFGYSKDEVDGVADHRAVLMARKAMLYDQMVSKAQATAKKVQNLPQRVERPSVGEANPNLDRRSQAYQRLNKSGRVEDAASLLSSFL